MAVSDPFRGTPFSNRGARKRGEPLCRIESCGSDELSNVAYGGPDARTLFITDAEGKILTARLPVPGHTLYSHR